ncbi:hypothetical protein BLNAU_16062 [Blattamonas nauphoetae]|uniref:IPT/TIG domain-containing protein n=1 Tax=Blattamonas nauphoetae TaxID=2049346 RepID=A0ABQ9XF79_9EUKA|nr:hypothetical protein BLNAU_16062 [Blattamonas nauphoetae]
MKTTPSSKTSILIVSCRHISITHDSFLLPLVSGSTSFSPSLESMKDPGTSELITDANCLSITGHGMQYLSNVFPLGTGPHFDFGTHPPADRRVGIDCTVSLTSTSFRNSTSNGSPRTPSGHYSSLTQKMIGCSMSHSTNHLSGTNGMNLNWRGSSLLMNSSFSTCVTNTDPLPITEPIFPSNVTSYQHFIFSVDRIAFNATSVLNNRVYVEDCLFTSLSSSKSGAGISLHNVEADAVEYSSLTSALATTTPARSQSNAFNIYTNLLIRFHNSTLARNTGYRVGGLFVGAHSQTSSIVLSDLLYLENESGMLDGYTLFPSLVGPCILSVAMTEKLNDANDGFLLEVTFEGMFTGTSRQYSLTLQETTGTEIVVPSLTFGQATSEPATLPLQLTSTADAFQFDTTINIVTMKKATTAASNDFDVGGDDEPDWSLWHHDISSKFGNLIPMSFTTPLPPTLTTITSTLDTNNLNVVLVTLTIDKVLGGDFKLIVTDTSDSTNTEIDLGTYSYEPSVTESSQSKSITIYPTGALAYGQTYRIKTLESPTLPIVHSSRTFTVPVGPARIFSAVGSLSGTNETCVTIAMTGERLPAGRSFVIDVQEMKGEVMNPDADKISLSGTFPGSYGFITEFSLDIEIYNKTDSLKFDQNYQIVSLTANGVKGVADPTARFEVPKSPGRVEATSDPKLNDGKTEVTVTLNGVGFTPTITSISVKGSTQTIAAKSVTVKSATVLEIVVPAGKTESTTTVEFGKEYLIASVTTSDSTAVYINSGVTFSVPVPSATDSTFIDQTHFVFDGARRTRGVLWAIGDHFQVGQKWKITFNTSLSIAVNVQNVTAACSEVIPVGSVGSIQHSTSYTMTSVTLEDDDSVHALFNPMAVLVIDDNLHFFVIFVKTGGSDDRSECGDESLACSTVLIGQEAGWMMEDKTVQISVLRSVEMGGSFRLIGEERTLILISATESRAVVKVSGDKCGEKKGVVEIEKGSLKVEHLILSLPTTVQSEEDGTHYAFTVDRQGTLEIEDTKITNDGQSIGMGLARVVSGRMVLHTTEVSGMTFGHGVNLIRAHSNTNQISVRMKDCVMMGTTTQYTPLVNFVAEDEESSFEMTGCRVSRTIRADSSDSSGTAGLIEVHTAQHQLNIVGSLAFTHPSFTPIPPRTLLISSCLFVDSNPHSPTSAALHISTHSEHTVVNIEDSWFETTTGSRPWMLFSSGIATLDEKRVVGRTANTSTGALVTSSKSLPIIIRRRVVFANCGLKMVVQS